ncbi:MAG TPA: AMP-binding protein, partial [Pyrinomonadaceae bacterium]|nr:AMP-binding protein [Pyrinomonadaceae bacterium]
MSQPESNDQSIQNLPDLVHGRVAASPSKDFLFSESDGRRFTYAEFEQAVNRTAGLMAGSGIKKGDVVSLLMPNSAEYIIAYFACWKLGALAGPINSLLKAQEIAYVISNSEARMILVHPDHSEIIDSIRSEVPLLETVILFDNEFEATRELTAPPDRQTVISCEDEAIIIYTSGTTGKPKGCLLTHGNLIANARQISEWLGFTGADRLLTIMPLFHMNAVSVTTMAALYAGGSTVVSPKFSASRFWNIISDYGITSFGSVATMLSMLLSNYPEGVPTGLKTEQLRFA